MIRRLTIGAAVAAAVFGGFTGWSRGVVTLPVVPSAAAATLEDSHHHAVPERERHQHRRGHR